MNRKLYLSLGPLGDEVAGGSRSTSIGVGGDIGGGDFWGGVIGGTKTSGAGGGVTSGSFGVSGIFRVMSSGSGATSAQGPSLSPWPK